MYVLFNLFLLIILVCLVAGPRFCQTITPIHTHCNVLTILLSLQAIGWPCHADCKTSQKKQTAAVCDLTLSIGGPGEDEADASSDIDGSSMTTEEAAAPVRDRGARDLHRSTCLNLDLNLDLAVPSSWLA
jgi:hypothetical protein